MKKTKALRKLTVAEKTARGTRQKCLDPKVRSSEAIQADIVELSESLESVRFTGREAGAAIRKFGPVVPSGRGASATVKPNPAVRIQAWALAAARGLKRELVFLREEEQLAQKPEHDDFEGLD